MVPITDMIFLNKVAQGLATLDAAVSWFRKMAPEAQLDVLRELVAMVVQARAAQGDVAPAVEWAGLRPTFTPCVLMLRGEPRVQGARVLQLPRDEWCKALALLLGMLAIADKRRRAANCAAGCQHWWHQDLENEHEVIRMATGR